jgi:ribose transport system substrate-binding protein
LPGCCRPAAADRLTQINAAHKPLDSGYPITDYGTCRPPPVQAAGNKKKRTAGIRRRNSTDEGGTMLSFRNALIGAGVLAAIGIGGAAAQATTIALVTINQQALFFNQVNDGAQAAADKNGAKLVVFNANNQAAAQNSAIEDYITQKVDGIVLLAIDVNGVKPAIADAKKAGIPVVAIDARIPDGDNAAFIGVDNQGAGAEIGKYFVDYVKSSMGGSAKVGIVGAVNSFIQNQRLDGFKKAVEASGAKITFLDTVDGQNVQDIALTASENLMTANPDMTALYATGEPALIGAISAVSSQKMTDKVKVFGWDLTAQAVKGIDEGWIVAVVQQDPYQEGVAGVESILKIKKGETVSPSIDIPVTIVTKKNVDKFRDMFK